MAQRLQILTWNVHAAHLQALAALPHDLWLVQDTLNPAGVQFRHGLEGPAAWPDNVHNAPAVDIESMRFDAVLYQHHDNWIHDRALLRPAQRELPAIALEHEPPADLRGDARHWAAGLVDAIVHVTPFDALMWEHGSTRALVIEPGIRALAPAHYSGEVRSGITVVDHLAKRGRAQGLDLFERVRTRVPLVLAGAGSESHGGLGTLAPDAFARQVARHRFCFHPARHEGLSWPLLHVLAAGVPVVAVAANEVAALLRDGDTGVVDTRIEQLELRMHELLSNETLAQAMGERGRRMVTRRYGMQRFVDEWDRLLRELCH